MKTCLILIIFGSFIWSCNSSKSTTGRTSQVTSTAQDTVRIANDSLEYEIIIIDPGFSTWLASTAKPEGYYSKEYMASRNWHYVVEWNQRVMQPLRFDPNLYEMTIDYQPHIDYGYEVNYKLYNYFIYFQLTYNQRLGPYRPRI